MLIESTANQCDQNGGYTGMKPMDFKNFVLGIADRVGFDRGRLFLGGDHLGPLTFAGKPEAEALSLIHISLVDYTVVYDLTDAHENALLGLDYILFAQTVAVLKSLSLAITPDNPCPTGEVNRVVKGVTLYPYTRA